MNDRPKRNSRIDGILHVDSRQAVRIPIGLGRWRIAGAGLAAAILATQCLSGAETEAGDRLSIHGETQLLAMERDFGNGVEGSSISISATADVESIFSDSLKFTGQYVHVENLDEGGRKDAAYWLSNDKASELTLAYLQFDGKASGWERTKVAIGRLPARYDFFPAYKVRHKAQSFEGVTLESAGPMGAKLEFGHIERYSAWPCRESGSSCLNAEFMEFGDRNGIHGSDSGVQFASADWSGDRVKIGAYDYYVGGFYNDFGAKISVSLTEPNAEQAWTLSARVDTQSADTSGAMPNQNATVAEANLMYRKGGFTLNTGWTNVSGDANFATPFRTSYAVDATLLWYTNQFEQGTDSIHCNAVYKRGKWVFANVFTAAWHRDDRREQELDIVVKRSFERGLWLAFKGGYGLRDFARSANRADEHARDLRLFAGYGF